MKKINLMWLTGCILVSLFAIILAGCQEEEVLKKDITVVDIPPPSQAEINFGNVNIRTTQNNEIVIAADIENEIQHIDGISEKLFILQCWPEQARFPDWMMTNARITMQAGSLEITSMNTGRVIYFTVDSRKPAGNYDEWLTGYGLSQNNGRWDFDLGFTNDHVSIYPSLCDNNYYLKSSGGGGGSGCLAGGPNATQCTYEEQGGIAGFNLSCKCSVTCGTGSYACCCACNWCYCPANSVTHPCTGGPSGGD